MSTQSASALFSGFDGIKVSPLVLSDRLLTLAEEADRAGLRSAAEKLLSLAHAVFDGPLAP